MKLPADPNLQICILYWINKDISSKDLYIITFSSGTMAFTSSEQLGNNANSWPKPTTISWPWLYKCIWPALIPTRQRRQKRRRHCNFPIESYSAKYSSTTCTVNEFIYQDYLANRNKLKFVLPFSV